jgi:hypothetical protein
MVRVTLGYFGWLNMLAMSAEVSKKPEAINRCILAQNMLSLLNLLKDWARWELDVCTCQDGSILLLYRLMLTEAATASQHHLDKAPAPEEMPWSSSLPLQGHLRRKEEESQSPKLNTTSEVRKEGMPAILQSSESSKRRWRSVCELVIATPLSDLPLPRPANPRLQICEQCKNRSVIFTV